MRFTEISTLQSHNLKRSWVVNSFSHNWNFILWQPREIWLQLETFYSVTIYTLKFMKSLKPTKSTTFNFFSEQMTLWLFQKRKHINGQKDKSIHRCWSPSKLFYWEGKKGISGLHASLFTIPNPVSNTEIICICIFNNIFWNVS